MLNGVEVSSGGLRGLLSRPDRHPYEIFYRLQGAERRTTRVRRPHSNGFVERIHRTLLDEHLHVMGQANFNEGVDKMQADLDAYLVTHNTKRLHQGRGMKD